MLIDREYLVEIDARDASGATVTLRYSRDGYMTRRSDTPADTAYAPRVADPGRLSLYLWGAGTTGGSSDVGWGTISLHNQDAGLDYLLTDGYGLAGVAVRVLIGAPGAARASFAPILTGTVESFEWAADGTVRVAVRDRQHLLSVTPLQDALYAGSNTPPNGIEGLARDLKGKGKPRLYGGQSRNFAPPLVNAQRLIYQVSDRPVATVGAVYEGGAPITAGAEMTHAQLTGDLTVTGYSATFTSANVNTGTDAIAISGAVFNAGDRCTLSAGTFNPFPSPISLKSGAGQQYESQTRYARGLTTGTVTLHPTYADAVANTNTVNLTTAGSSGITFTMSCNGSTRTFTSANVSTAGDTISVTAFSGRDFPNGSAGGLSFPSSTPILPAPLAAGTSYYLSGTAAAVKFHATAADAAAGTNAINLTSTGQSGVTFTATIYTTGVEMDAWRDFNASAVNTSTDEINLGAPHGISTGDVVCVRKKFGTGSLPAPLSATTYYYARAVSTTVVTLHTSRAGAVANTGRVNITSQGSTTPTADATNQISRTYVIPGTYCWCHDATAGTYLRLGTKPVKAITADATAEAASADRTVAQVLKDIAIDAGIASGDVVSADVTALDAACAFEVAEYLAVGDTRSARTVMDAVAASIGAWYAFDATGKLRMGWLDAPTGTPALTLTADAIYEVERTQSGDDGSGVPTWRCTVRYGRSVVVQDTDALVGAVTDDQAAFVGREYREVTSEDATVLTVHPGAPERAFETRLTAEASATDMAARWQSLYGARRDLLRVRVPLTAAVAAAELGDVVSITWPKLGLAAGRLTLLVGIETAWREDQATLLLWG